MAAPRPIRLAVCLPGATLAGTLARRLPITILGLRSSAIALAVGARGPVAILLGGSLSILAPLALGLAALAVSILSALVLRASGPRVVPLTARLVGLASRL